MTGFKSVIPALIICILAAACSAQLTKDIKVTAKQRPGVDLSHYRTFAWLDSAQVVNDPLGQWEPPDFDSDAEVKRLVAHELVKRGITLATGKPDMVVTFVAGIDMASLELREDPEKGAETLQNIPKGALVVVLADAATRVRLWVGVAAGDVGQQYDSAAVRRRLDYAITGMFRQYPAH